MHYICDIAIDELYILDHEAATMPQTPDQERSFAAFSQRQAQNERRQLDQAQGRGPGSTGMDMGMGAGAAFRRLGLAGCWSSAGSQHPDPEPEPLQERLDELQQQVAEQLPYLDRRMFLHLHFRKHRVEI